MALTPDEFARTWSSWDLNQRLGWLRLVNGGRIDVAAEDKVIKEWAATQYGAYSAYLDHPEIGPILLRAAREGWTPQKLQLELSNTTWWKTQPAAAREWDALKSQDPASADAKLTQLTSNIQMLIEREGVAGQFGGQDLRALAEQLLRSGASENDIPRMVLQHIQYTGDHPIGEIGKDMGSILARAAEYEVPLSEQDAFAWAKKIALGTATPEVVDDYLKEIAMGAYSYLAPGLEAGHTVREILAPMIQQTAQLLEVDPTTIDLRDSRYSPILMFNDGSQQRNMNLAEAAQFIRSKPEWRDTTNAKNTEASFATSLLQKLGSVA